MADTRPPRIVITGVSRGLGYALARSFANRGSMVFGTISKRMDVAFDGLAADATAPRVHVASACDAKQMAAFAACLDGAPDIVIANAGTINDRRPAWEIPEGEWRRVLDINLIGVVETARAFLPTMIDAGRGLFVAMSSGWGRSAASGLGPYCASKFAVEGFVGTLIDDLPDGVQAVALDPGNGINTSMLETCMPDEHDRYIRPEEWAEYAAGDITRFWHERTSGSLTVTHPGLSI